MTKRPKRWIVGAVLSVAAASVSAPYLGADGFIPLIRTELERILGRKVDIHGKAAFQLLPRPGFSVLDVVIHEDPAMGVEPLAYVANLEVGISVSSIWRRRIGFSAVRLEAPSINLMKAPDGAWNVQSLVEHVRRSLKEGSEPPPEIEVSEGRLNFKSGDLKSVYYLAEADVSVAAADAQRLSIRFSGIPARTDRQTHGFGRLSGRGSIEVPENSAQPGRIEVSVALERTAAAEILTLVQGRGVGLGGFVTARAQLDGGFSNLDITGRMQLDEFERWSWLMPGNAGWGLDFKGALNVDEQSLEVETRAPERARQLPLSVRLRATRLMGDTSWGALITLRDVPLSSLRSLAEETGSAIPPGLPLDGLLTGALGYSPKSGFRGQVAVAKASLKLPDLPPLRFEELHVVADGAQVSLGPATLRVSDTQSARLEARLAPGTPAMDVSLASVGGVQLSHLQEGWRQLTGAPLPAVLAWARGGTVSGALRFQQTGDEETAAWTGAVELAATQISAAGLSSPVRIESGHLRLKGGEAVLAIKSGTCAGVPFSGVYERPAAERRPHRLRLDLPALTIRQVDAALAPAFGRRQGFLARTLRLGSAPVPEWLLSRRLIATVHAASFDAGDYRFENLHAQVNWSGARVDVREIAATLESGTLTGSLAARLTNPVPVWSGQMRLHGYRWRDGRLEAEAAIEATGHGQEFLDALRLDGSFRAQDLLVSPEVIWREASGCFTYQSANGSPRLHITGLYASIGGETFLGQGVPGAEGRVTIELASAQRTLRVPARLNGLSLDLPIGR